MILVMGGFLLLADALLCFIAGGVVSNHDLGARLDLLGLALLVVLPIYVVVLTAKLLSTKE
ncbi:MAG: hypothetical protein IJ856_02010 [Candidatus Methanomethylophilaceae archaeon]|nr:hypothetical protein [Candidatus Methanomethylophilaceae archaeon]